jgi:hypothetical protein
MYVPGGTGRTVSISTLMNIAVATYPRVYVRPMYSVLQCTVAGLYSSHFRRALEYVLQEFMPRYFAILHDGTSGSYLRDALRKGSADAVACLRVPRAEFRGFSSLIFS